MIECNVKHANMEVPGTGNCVLFQASFVSSVKFSTCKKVTVNENHFAACVNSL